MVEAVSVSMIDLDRRPKDLCHNHTRTVQLFVSAVQPNLQTTMTVRCRWLLLFLLVLPSVSAISSPRQWFGKPVPNADVTSDDEAPSGWLQRRSKQKNIKDDASKAVRDEHKGWRWGRKSIEENSEESETKVPKRGFFSRRDRVEDEETPPLADGKGGVLEGQKKKTRDDKVKREVREKIAASQEVSSPTKRRGFFGGRQSSERESDDSETDPPEEKEQKNLDEPVPVETPLEEPVVPNISPSSRRERKKKERPTYTVERVRENRIWFGRKKKEPKQLNRESKSKVEAELDALDVANTTVASNVTVASTETKNETIAETESESSSTNGTDTAASINATSTLPPTGAILGAPPSGMIITGYPQGMPPGGPYRYYRRSGPPGMMPPPPTGAPGSTVLIAEVLASVLATLSRLWFLTWVTKRIASQEESHQPTQHYVWERVNDRYQRDATALRNAIQAPPTGISKGRWQRRHVWRTLARQRPEQVDLGCVFTRTVVVVELSDDSKKGINLDQLSEVVSFLLQQRKEGVFGTHKETQEPMELEIVFLVQSPGGSVSTFGLAAAQMQRLSQVQGITTTVCVDKYAASGGYMIASQADKLLAAPFATLGSIGVIMEGLNFNELAQRYGVQPVVLKAGSSKNPVSTFGPISNADLRHEEARLAKVHDAFRDLVVQGRPAMVDSITLVGDGSVFLGQEALDLHMVDGIMTSDEYILERIFARDRVLRLHQSYQARMPRRVGLSPLDLLPHLKGWFQNMDKTEARLLFARLIRTGGFLGVAQQFLKSFLLSRQ